MAGIARLDRSQRLGQFAPVEGFKFRKTFLNVRTGGIVKPPFFVQLQHIAFKLYYADDRCDFLRVRRFLPARRSAQASPFGF